MTARGRQWDRRFVYFRSDGNFFLQIPFIHFRLPCIQLSNDFSQVCIYLYRSICVSDFSGMTLTHEICELYLKQANTS